MTTEALKLLASTAQDRDPVLFSLASRAAQGNARAIRLLQRVLTLRAVAVRAGVGGAR